MYNLSDINQIQKILNKNGFSFSKALGQNFIIDPSICPTMAEHAVESPEYGVLEIGPGIGVLTVELAKRAKKVVSIELDSRLLPILDETLSEYDNVEIINGDVLELDLNGIIREKFGGMKVVVCANLPYYITSPIIMKLLEERLPIESLIVMVQAEAADRLCAKVGTRESGAVTIAVNFYAHTEQLFFVPRTAFMPEPKVDSKVIKLNIRKEPFAEIKDEDTFFTMVKAAFSKRRKTVMNSLVMGTATKERLADTLDKHGIPKTSRIEQFSMDDLVTVYKDLYE